MRSRYVVCAFAETTPQTWRHRAAAAMLSVATLVVIALMLWDGRHQPAPARSASAPLLVHLLPLPPPAQARAPPPREPRLGGAPAQKPVPARSEPTRAAARTTPPVVANTTPAPSPAAVPPPPPVPATAPTGPPADGAGDGRTVAAGPGPGEGGGAGRGSGGGVGEGEGLPEVLVAPRWVRKPTDYDLAPFFPRAARTTSTSGVAALACRVRRSTEVERCRVLAERPAGFGFGAAAVKASRIFRVHPTRRNGRIAPETWVAVTIEWVFKRPPPPPAAPPRQGRPDAKPPEPAHDEGG